MSRPTTDPGSAMDCARVIRDEIAEQYVAGRLSEEVRAAFEDHYFSCDRCFADVEAWRALAASLPEDAQRQPARSVARWWPVALATAAIIVVAVGLYRFWLRPVQPAGIAAVTTPAIIPAPTPPGGPPSPGSVPVATLAALSAVTPPPYVPMRVRGSSDEAAQRFEQAMTHYQKRDYVAAIPGLQAAASLDATSPQAPFYLGICYLMTDDTAPASERLAAVVALGESGSLEDAHFFLAKAALRKGDVAGARAELTKTVALHGDREAEAGRLLADLAKIEGGPPGGR
jgi:tetratricopeptide (TPR) repeat protein